LPVYCGEWRADDNAYLLEGTLSTRVYLKKKHTSLSHILEGCVEPLWTTLFSLGFRYPKGTMDFLWKLLLHNSPHDSICGCSVDSVHEEMMVRYRKMEDIIEKLYQEAEDAISSILWAGSGDNVVIFNPHPWPVTAYLECNLHLNSFKEREVDFEASRLQEHKVPEKGFYSSLVFKDANGEIIPEVLNKEWVTWMKITPSTLPEVFRSQRYRVGFVASLPPCGFRIYQVTPAEEGKKSSPGNKEQFLLANEFYEIRVSEGGEVEIREKATNIVLPLRLVVEDSADAGDEYNYSPCLENDVRCGDNPLVSWRRRDRFVQSVLLKYGMKIPASLRPDRKGRSKEEVLLPVEIELCLALGTRWIELYVNLCNNARDHRVRLLFETPMRDCVSFVDAHFAVVERNVEEKDCPQNDFVLVQDDTKMLAVLNQGLREYAITRTEDGRKALAVTLLRSVGWLSRNDLLTRKGDAGWPISTEGAQCLGEHSFRLGMVVSGKRFPEFPIVREARLFNQPPMIFQISGGRGNLVSGWSLLECDNPYLAVSALKQREGRDEVVLRLYNPTPLPQRFKIFFGLPLLLLKELSLLEEEEHICPLSSSSFLEDELRPFEMKTWGLVFGKAIT
jgi:alpha-mannosidase/mannosylglycerate hydrolase